MIKSFFISLAIIFCATIIETSILCNLYILPVLPDLVLICSVYISLCNGRTFGELNGFASGLILDWITGVPYGLNCILRTILGYVYGFFANHIFIGGILVPVISVGTATLLKYLIITFISFFYTAISPVSIFSMSFLYELLFNSVLSIIIFKFLSFFKKNLSIYPETGSSNV